MSHHYSLRKETIRVWTLDAIHIPRGLTSMLSLWQYTKNQNMKAKSELSFFLDPAKMIAKEMHDS